MSMCCPDVSTSYLSFFTPLRVFIPSLWMNRAEPEHGHHSDLILFHTWIKPAMKPYSPYFLVTELKTSNFLPG